MSFRRKLSRPLAGLCVLAVPIAVTGCSTGSEEASAPPGTAPASAASQAVPSYAGLLDPSVPELNRPAPERFKVLFETTEGDFVVEVVSESAPVGARRFYNLVDNGFYDGARFFRVLPGFVAQFGIHAIPEVSAAWREARIPDDPVTRSNTRATLTFATAGPNTRTTQLFINLVDNARLDSMDFAPFGVVTGGMDVVDRLHGDYGEAAPSGQGPDQERIRTEGEAYLARDFPLLDRIDRARIIDS